MYISGGSSDKQYRHHTINTVITTLRRTQPFY